MSKELIARLNDEADLCANEGAFDITHLLLEASREIEQQAAEIERLRSLLRECEPWVDFVSGDLGRRISAALAEQK